MKKILSIILVGIGLLILLAFMPSNTLENEVTVDSDNNYLTLVPAKPPATPPKK